MAGALLIVAIRHVIKSSELANGDATRKVPNVEAGR
jgi:hypothetical protein